MTRVLDELDEILELRGRIARKPGEGCFFPKEGDQISLDIWMPALASASPFPSHVIRRAKGAKVYDS